MKKIYRPGLERVLALAAAIVVDERGRLLTHWHKDRGQYWPFSGKMQDALGQDIIRIVPADEVDGVIRKLSRMQRESRRAAVRREVCQEGDEEMQPPIVRRPLRTAHARRQVKFLFDYPMIRLRNKRGDGTRYTKPIPTTSAIFCSLTVIPPDWMEDFQRASGNDPRVYFAPLDEIQRGVTSTGRPISLDLYRILEAICFHGLFGFQLV